MKKAIAIISLMFSILVAITPITSLTAQAESYGGYAKGYSDWADTPTGNPGEVQRTVWRYADAIFENSCTHNTNYETYDVPHTNNGVTTTSRMTLYQTCKWDPYNCAREVCENEVYQGEYFVACGNSCCCGINFGKVVQTSGRCSDGGPATCYACYECTVCTASHTEYNAPCGAINDGHQVFKGWGSWSAWSTTQYHESNSRKVEWKYQYSYPYPPVLGLKHNQYFVGYETSAAELLTNAIATDLVDGVISSKVKLTSIVYADGTVDTNPTKLNTEKEQTFVLNVKVTNTRGLTTTASKEYQIFDLWAPGRKDPDDVNPEAYTNVDVYDRFVGETNDKNVFGTNSNNYLDTIQSESIWKVDEAYKQALSSALAKQSGEKISLNE